MATHKAVLPGPSENDGIEAFLGRRELAGVDVKTRMAIFHVRSSDGSGPDGPDFRVPISSILPDREDDSLEFWRLLVDDVMRHLQAESKVPDFVKDYEVSVDEDSTGEPALYVRVLVAPKNKYSEGEVERWLDFTNLLQDLLLALHIQRYPYVQVGEVRRRK